MAIMITGITVASNDSGEIKEYEVTVDPVTKGVRCSCPAYQYAKHVKVCKHIVAVNDLVNPEHD